MFTLHNFSIGWGIQKPQKFFQVHTWIVMPLFSSLQKLTNSSLEQTMGLEEYYPKDPDPSKLAILRTRPLQYRFKPFHWRVKWSLGYTAFCPFEMVSFSEPTFLQFSGGFVKQSHYGSMGRLYIYRSSRRSRVKRLPSAGAPTKQGIFGDPNNGGFLASNHPNIFGNLLGCPLYLVTGL